MKAMVMFAGIVALTAWLRRLAHQRQDAVDRHKRILAERLVWISKGRWSA